MKPVTAQSATRKQLESMGFSMVEQCAKSVVMHRGNDYRVIQQDGTQKRAIGAKR